MHHLYLYGTGERSDGFRFAVAEGAEDGNHDLALFVDKVEAHLFAHDKAARLGAVNVDPTRRGPIPVSVLPSADLGTGVGGWPLALVREPYKALRRGELTLMCPNCSSYDVSVSLRTPPVGTGPGMTWRLGDPGATQYAYCHGCHTSSDH